MTHSPMRRVDFGGFLGLERPRPGPSPTSSDLPSGAAATYPEAALPALPQHSRNQHSQKQGSQKQSKFLLDVVELVNALKDLSLDAKGAEGKTLNEYAKEIYELADRILNVASQERVKEMEAKETISGFLKAHSQKLVDANVALDKLDQQERIALGRSVSTEKFIGILKKWLQVPLPSAENIFKS